MKSNGGMRDARLRPMCCNDDDDILLKGKIPRIPQGHNAWGVARACAFTNTRYDFYL